LAENRAAQEFPDADHPEEDLEEGHRYDALAEVVAASGYRDVLDSISATNPQFMEAAHTE